MQDRLTRIFAIVVDVLRVGNIAILIAAALALVATFLWSDPLIAHLDRGYGAAGGAALVYMRIMIVSCLPVAYIVERLFRALAQILATLRTGDAFASANAKRLQLIGWALLAIQIADALSGLSTLWAKSEHIRVVDWTPSFTGWLGVLVAFVLARVFAQGTAMRDDLAGTV